MKKLTVLFFSLLCASSWAQTITIKQDNKVVSSIEISKLLIADVKVVGDQCLMDKANNTFRCTGNVQYQAQDGAIKIKGEDITVQD